jgi:hypothetical protein
MPPDLQMGRERLRKKRVGKTAIQAILAELEFGTDGKMVYRVGSQPCNGTYALGLGPTVTFNLENEVDGRKIHPQKIVIDGDRLTMTDPDGSQVTFQRVQ